MNAYFTVPMTEPSKYIPHHVIDEHVDVNYIQLSLCKGVSGSTKNMKNKLLTAAAVRFSVAEVVQ